MVVSCCFPLWQHPRGMGDRLGKTWRLIGGGTRVVGREAEQPGKGETSTFPGNELR